MDMRTDNASVAVRAELFGSREKERIAVNIQWEREGKLVAMSESRERVWWRKIGLGFSWREGARVSKMEVIVCWEVEGFTVRDLATDRAWRKRG